MSDQKKTAKIALAVLLPAAIAVLAWQFFGGSGGPAKDPQADSKAAQVRQQYAEEEAKKPKPPEEPPPAPNAPPPSRNPSKK